MHLLNATICPSVKARRQLELKDFVAVNPVEALTNFERNLTCWVVEVSFHGAIERAVRVTRLLHKGSFDYLPHLVLVWRNLLHQVNFVIHATFFFKESSAIIVLRDG